MTEPKAELFADPETKWRSVLKKMAVILILIIVLIVLAVAVGYWWSFGGYNPIVDVTSGTDYILAWKERTTIDTRLGTVTGLSNGRVHAFLGLRYAQPPTGDRRFLPPEATLPWEGTYDATAFPRIATQNADTPLEDGDPSQISEDCLFLNIFAPSTEGANRPVLFWIHGGAFIEGSANGYDGSVLAEQGDVVVVAINYRLGFFGFLDLSGFGDEFAGSASNGIRDQILALEWVRDNIADYGGDPNNITIFGESAGGHSVLSVISAPSADGLYHKAIVHSSPSVNGPPQDQSQALAKRLKVDLADVPAELRRLSAEDLLAVSKAMFGGGGKIDGTVVTRSSNDAILDRAANGVPLIAGTNRDEGTFFSYVLPPIFWGFMRDGIAEGELGKANVKQYRADLKKAYPRDNRKEHFERVFTEMLRRGVLNSASRASAAGPGGWVYRFDMPIQRGVNKDLGATHGAEIAFTFNNFAGDAPDSAFFYDRNDPEVRQLALNWSNTIIQFAKTGDPNGAGLPFWPKYTAEDRQTLILDATPRVEAFLDAADRERWGDTETASSDFTVQGTR